MATPLCSIQKKHELWHQKERDLPTACLLAVHSVDNVARVGRRVMHLVPAGWLPASARSGRSRRQCFSVSLSSAIAAVSLSHVKLLWIAGSEKDQSTEGF